MATPKKPGAVRGRPRVYPVGMTREAVNVAANAPKDAARKGGAK